MPNGLVILCRGVALAFLCNDMQHARPVMILYLAQYAYQSFHIMPVRWTEIADVQTGKDIVSLLAQNGFQVVVSTQNHLPFVFVHQVQLYCQLI